ncbi:sensor histidine kinase [Anaeromicrobium sediminis]|uniref:histidine kinase n=1 Tax=Anaeromicrobium sediminis TaxID=1478221 RepID=A0A267MEJ5_9FIRM|nr:HAMP domain-containing sensor histidine kinase [Anaeromicrobium sediminis]PAB57223.1 hypothetical protein CCE28_19245 [Anaeromicrobium sediminis]
MRKKILTAFSLSLIIPIIINISLFYLINNSTVINNYLISDVKLNEKTIKDIEDIEIFLDKFTLKLEDNYSNINDYDTFYKEVFKNNKKYIYNVQIIDSKNMVLFDALNKNHINNKLFTKEEITPFTEDDNYRTATYIYKDNEIVATALISLKFNLGSYFEKYAYITLSISIFSLLILVGLIIFFSFKISKSISEPIKSLHLSAEAISQGNFNVSVPYNEKNEIGKFCSVFDNMRIELKNSFEEKKKYEESRKELFACISHDLRTPITSIKSYVEGLEQGLATNKEKQDRYLSVIKNKTNQLDKMIDDLFCLSQLEIGKFPMDFQVEDSNEIFTDIFNTFEIEFKDKPINFKINNPIPSVKLKCDKRRISQVISNIVENGKKYVGHDGLIQVSTVLEDTSLIISIKDNGSGIEPDNLPYVFDHFFTGEKSRTKKHGGTGLGLAICKQIIKAHGGHIWIESTVHIGTTVYFKLPFIV